MCRTSGRKPLSRSHSRGSLPAWREHRRRRARRVAISCLLGAAVGGLAQVATALTGDSIYAYLAVYAVGGIGIVFGLALIVGLNLGRPLAIREETPSEAAPPRPFTGVCLLLFAVSVIDAAALSGGLLLD
jgi:hypothetical protein